MDRNRLKVLLKHYRTPFEEEQAFLSDFIRLVDDSSSFSRERKTGHFTASAWIVNRERTHTLLTLHKKLNRWLQLGGHADGNENLLEVAMQEAREESGLTSLQLVNPFIFDIDKHTIPAFDKEAQHYHFDVRFLIEAVLDEPLIKSPESRDLAWISFGSVAEMVSHNPSILRMLEKTGK